MGISLLTVCYLIASVTFILGLKMLSNPARARKGNIIAAGGMALAIIGSIFLYEDNGGKLHNYGWFFGGIVVGGIAGTLAARKVLMTAMPEVVSLFIGMGGACAALISIVEFGRLGKFNITAGVDTGELLIILLGLIIGTIFFVGCVFVCGLLFGR